MSDLYISYGTRERHWVSLLASRLDDAGYDVCWNSTVVPGQDFYESNGQAMQASRCILSIWSETSVEDYWVLNDSEAAMANNTLLSLRHREVVIPESMRIAPTVDVTAWDEGSLDSVLEPLLKLVASRCEPSKPTLLERKQAATERENRLKAESARREASRQKREQRAAGRRKNTVSS
ncbi:toll/interleukin-1 receptor domain-containing protein [Leucothrix mucor]|uniref:toll/interleukin-1 receptor domain-containing protein n=1 Tax=Leucothrix mucor TaxID=45248 RepID=UPI0003B5BD31|nr:toll/interleukin-1 receptor domain-containing protein [Leucothrix mucor]